MPYSLNTPIDIYCERTEAEFWAEPVNALTNGAFLLTAWIGWRVARRARRLDAAMVVLIALTASIGVGSFLFHTIATRWAAIVDVVPIGLFIAAYLATVLRQFFGLRWPLAIPVGASLIPAGWGLSAALPPTIKTILAGSAGYLPALFCLVACGGLLIARRHRAGPLLMLGAAVFTVSLGFRTLDMAVCPAFPIGTHFLWHVLNGTVLAILLVALARYGSEPRCPGSAARR
jgi:hypothetical protein